MSLCVPIFPSFVVFFLEYPADYLSAKNCVPKNKLTTFLGANVVAKMKKIEQKGKQIKANKVTQTCNCEEKHKNQNKASNGDCAIDLEQ